MPEAPGYIANKIAELRAFAKEYEHYSSKMPNDPFALRWRIIAEALSYQASSLEMDALLQSLEATAGGEQ